MTTRVGANTLYFKKEIGPGSPGNATEKLCTLLCDKKQLDLKMEHMIWGFRIQHSTNRPIIFNGNVIESYSCSACSWNPMKKSHEAALT